MAIVTLRSVDVEHARHAEEALVIVRGLDLEVDAGDIRVLAGRSGSGKTSVLRVAAGLVAPAAGDVLWNGTSLIGLPDDRITALRHTLIGYLDQGGALLESLTAVENVLVPLVPQRVTPADSDRAIALLERLGVAERSHHRPSRLSVGERHRVALARALITSPSVLMADEPTASLDRISADAVIDLLRSLAADGIGVLVATHDPHLIAAADSTTELA